MKKSLFSIFIVMSIVGVMSVKQALADAPVQVAVINPVQIVDETSSIKGLRLNIMYGVNEDVTGIDLGLINKTEGEQKGIQLGIYNSTFDASGLQLGLVNRTDWLNGIQVGLINIHAEGERSFFPIVNFAF